MITAQGLRKRYGDKTAVDDLSFNVRPGVVTGFLGPNGAGKSTTMRLMLDLDHGAGETRFDGRRFDEIRHPMHEIGAVLEAKAFHPTRTARNHLRMLAAGSRIPRKRVDEVLDFVGLSDVKSKKPRGFSLGMAQRLGLAQALLGEPGTLILDEPANGLDPHGIHWLRDVLKTLASQGRTIFVSSHLLSEMSLMADELVVIGRGKMIFNGDVDTFVRQFTQSTVLVKTPSASEFAETLKGMGATIDPAPEGGLLVSGADASVIGELAHRDNIILHELATQSASLEEAFITATGASEEYVAHGLTAPEATQSSGVDSSPPAAGREQEPSTGSGQRTDANEPSGGTA
ncbi:ATP-binding cassette domain-containing protein [Phytoactinopolyspora mesophila]|uniref:ATP-binding cassette domain-containing protein n=1 Tax=Phytoactinopolyspora mesophila TaxID=2650750 RepID=A0A7K3MA08_9ACTN|nr:ATP-binding cassette domain-containing protein [Phytoactinopolyspora mesophila]NDL60124.1 ATP-binding cassette domain-containing protein [Phytoactinopolyspora mesophila]